MNQKWRWWGIILLFFLTLLPFHRVLLYSDRALLYRDLGRDFLIQKSFLANSIRAGNGIPYWNHFAFGGMKYYAQNVVGPLNPLNLIFVPFSKAWHPYALNLFIFIHYLLLFAGTYFLFRVIRVQRSAAFIVAGAFTFSGYNLGAFNLLHILSSMVAIPPFFAFWILWLRRKENIHLLMASFFLAFPIYAGDPQFTYISAIAAFCLLWTKSDFLKHKKQCIFGFLSLACLSLLCSSAQLLPSIEFALESERALGELNRANTLLFSFHPWRMVETFIPQFYGNRFGSETFWIKSLINYPERNPFIFSTYIGGIAVTFFLISLNFLAKKSFVKNRKNIFIGLACLFFLFLSFGVFSWLPLYELCMDYVPLFKAFRYPERLFFWANFLFFIYLALAAKRLHLLQKISKKIPLYFYALFPGIFSILTLILGIIILFWNTLPRIAAKPSFIASASVAVLILILHFFFKKKYMGPLFFSAILYLAVDVQLNNSNLLWDQSIHVLDHNRYDLLNSILQDIKNRKSEIQAGAAQRFTSSEVSDFYAFGSLMDHPTLSTFAAYEKLIPNTSLFFGIEDVSGYYSFTDKHKYTFWDSLIGDKSKEKYKFVYNILSTYYVPERGANGEVVPKINPEALPYLFIPQEIRTVPSNEFALKALSENNFPYKKTILIENLQPGESSQSQAISGTFLIQNRDGKTMHFIFTPEKDAAKGMILVNESIDKHWHASVDSKPTEIFRGNAWAMAINLEGLQKNIPKHIIFRYENPYIYYGQWASALWLLIIGFFILRRQTKF